MTHFETKVCSRCGGSGEYSYCSMYGRTCFKCNGRKSVYTPRGQAAKQWYEARLSKPAGELQIGDAIYVDGMFTKAGFSKVISIEPDTTLYNGAIRPDYLRIQTEKMGQYISKDTLCRVAHTAEQKQVILAEALQYQASLTQAGTPKKRQVAA